MDNFNNICLENFKNKEFQKQLKLLLTPLIELINSNISIYLYIFVFFILINFLLNLGILIILMRYIKLYKKI